MLTLTYAALTLWYKPSYMASWLTTVCALLAVRLLALEALAERAKRTSEVTLYRAPIGMRVLLGAAIVGMVYGAGAVVLSENFERDWWVSVMLLVMAVFCALQWPADLESRSLEFSRNNGSGCAQGRFTGRILRARHLTRLKIACGS